MVWKPVLETGKGSLLGNMLDGPEMKIGVMPLKN